MDLPSNYEQQTNWQINAEPSNTINIPITNDALYQIEPTRSHSIGDSQSNNEENRDRLESTTTSPSPSRTRIDPEEFGDRGFQSTTRFPLSLPIQSNHDEFSVIDNNLELSTRRAPDNCPVSTKELKQRQNEERKTPASASLTDGQLSSYFVESSSVSSENGSWEVIYPPRIAPVEPTCESFLQNERTFCSQSDKNTTSDTNILSDNSKIISGSGGSSSGACFIDASTLLDDGDVIFINTYSQNPANIAEMEKDLDLGASTSSQVPVIDANEHSNGSNANNNSFDEGQINKHLVLKKSKENLNEDIDRDETEMNSSIINLSDEQKLSTKQSQEPETSVRQQQQQQQQQYDIKDQYANDAKEAASFSFNSSNSNSNGNQMENHFKYSAERVENERKQGHFLFQNSIQQFSGHTMSPKVPYLEENNSDFSLPSIHSGGSDPYTDNASAFETSSHMSSNYSDRDSYDYGELSHISVGNSKVDTVIYPETPHNSILHVNLSRSSLGPNDSAIASLSSSESNVISISHQRSHDDTIPIISGGASVKDFTPKQCESPLMQRKTDNCPIISVGMSSLDYETKPKPKERTITSIMNSWVVDMSDCKKNRRRGSESSSVSNESSRFSDSRIDRSGSGSSHKGLGFYVSLSDMKPPRLAEEMLSKSLNYHSSSSSCASAEPKKKSTGFFVDFSNGEDSHGTETGTSGSSRNAEPANKKDDKKNIFSMFIDFGNDEQRASPKRTPNSEIERSNTNNVPDPVVVPRKNRPNTNPIQETIDYENKRHSWNTTKSNEPMPPHNEREHKRSTSTSSDKGIMNILDKIPLISKTSSMSIDTPNSPYDDITSKSLSTYSINSLTSLSMHSGGSKRAEPDERTNKRRQKDAKINETFDKSSQGSLTDGILSKNSSSTPNTETDDVTFHNENDDTLHDNNTNTNQMETIPETREAVVLRRPHATYDANNCKVERHTMETLQATIEKQKQLLNTVTEEPSTFVKLSDMDKPVPKFELHNTDNRPKSVGSRIGKLFDNRAGNRNTWHHMSKSAGNNLSNLASSAENFKSLTRIFPHLSKDLSNSLPINFEQSSNSSPNDYTMDLFHSDFSTSSATSSFSRSGIDSADELSLSALQPRRLGEDLLKMFLQEIATDVIIEVNGRRLRAHKCILRSRCQYFAAILAGGWVESAGNTITLSGYSYGSVHFALCHIYSGASHPPEGISLMELAALADLLGLEGLKEVAAHSLRTNYCHSFHKPCSGCIDGVMQVFPVALNQGLDDLYRKCLRWACKHYMKVWPSRAFSQLPTELVARCKQHIIAHMTSESVIYTLLDCDHLLALLAPCRWASGVESNVRDIIEAGHIYVTDHFASLIASDGFLSLGQGQSWNISRLENMLLRSASSLTADQACRSYQRVTRLDSVLKAKINKSLMSRIDKSMFMSDYDNEINGDEYDDEELDWNPDFIRLVGEILTAVESCLVQQCSRAMKCNQWQRMDAELQQKAQKLACLTEPAERRIQSSRPKPALYHSSSSSQSNRAHDLYQVKMAIQAHTKRTQEGSTTQRTVHVQPQAKNRELKSASTAAKVTKSSTHTQIPDLISTIKPTEPNIPVKSDRKSLTVLHRRSVSLTANHRQLIKEKSSGSVESKLRKSGNFQDVKPRYLEPKRQPDGLKVRALSSSGSSRTSSPIASARIKNGSGHQLNKKVMSDSISMSRDSLASPAKRSEKIQTNDRHDIHQPDHERLSADSLGGSLHSSVITNKTISQESLVKPDLKHKTTQNHPINAKHLPQSIIGKGAQLKVCGNLISQNSSTVNSSTPSSMTVKSYLSSSNSINSPRDMNLKGRLTTPATQLPVKKTSESKPATKSFLSARSRQILAHKKSLSHSDSSKSVPSVIKENNLTNAVNKSSSTSNILGRKSKNIPLSLVRPIKLTTSHQQPLSLPPDNLLKINNQSASHSNSLMNPTKSSTMKMVNQLNKLNRDKDANKQKTKTIRLNYVHSDGHDSNTDHENDLLIDFRCSDASDTASVPPIPVESKLERSSTFCKERSEITTNID